MKMNIVRNVFCAVICLTATVPSLAALQGSDDFNDGVIDSAKWVSYAPGTREYNGELQYQNLSGNGSAGILEWIGFSLDNRYNWSAMVDINLPNGLINESLPDDQEVSVTLYTGSTRDYNDYAELFLGESREEDEGEWEHNREAAAKKITDGSSQSIYLETPATYASLMISWDAALNNLSFYFDADGNQDSFSPFAEFNISDWNMQDGDRFNLGISATTNNVPFSWEDGVFMENFNIVSSVPEPGSLLLFSFGIVPVIRLIRRNRRQ